MIDPGDTRYVTDLIKLGPFSLTSLIGEGGMGKVYAANQPVLAREVAIKRVRSGNNAANSAAALIQEAHLLARLEHPNIPPVHALGRDAQGFPALVMKRVRGVTWSDIATEPEHRWWKRVTGDRLTWHLRVLINVCNVIAYAHSRRVLHRDIKLDNVMIGSFGETYLLDWGAAVGLDEHGEYSTTLFSGTPANAAPEMVRCDAPLSAVTDVYLLGALLHEVLTGQPRHAARSLKEMLRSAARSHPFNYASHVPKKLAELCNRAMHRDPAKRPARAALFREEIETFLEQRGASRLLDAADQLLAQLREHRQQGFAHEDAPEGNERRRDDLFHGLAVRCRFAYEQALSAAPELEHAYRGLAECLVLQVQQTAENRNYQAARTLLRELSELPSSSAKQIAELDGYIAEQEQSHKDRRDELATQVHHALVDRLRIAEENLRQLQSRLGREREPDS